MTSQPFCLAPFNRVYVGKGKESNITFNPCCVYKFKPEFTNINDYLKSEELNNLKNHFINNKNFSDGCNFCKTQEDNNQQSLRQSYNSKLSKYETTDIIELEYFPNNTCNLKCFSCYPESSSAVGAERYQLGWIKEYKEIDNSDYFEDIISNLPHLKKISIIGGEFFLAKQNLKILDLCIANGLSLSFFTNSTIILPKHIEKLQNIKDLQIRISIDGTNDIYEFIRYPAKWEIVKENIENLKTKLPQSDFEMNTVVQPLNIQNIVQIVNFANKIQILPRLSPIIKPHWLNWSILNKDECVKLNDYIDIQLLKYRLSKKQINEIQSIKQILINSQHNTNNRNEFIGKMSQTLSFRKITQENILTVFNNLDNLANEIIKKM